MGVKSRTQVKDWAKSRSPEVGEIIHDRSSILLGMKGGYVNVQELAQEVKALRKILDDPDVVDMISWFKGAKKRAVDLGISREDLESMLF